MTFFSVQQLCFLCCVCHIRTTPAAHSEDSNFNLQQLFYRMQVKVNNDNNRAFRKEIR